MNEVRNLHLHDAQESKKPELINRVMSSYEDSEETKKAETAEQIADMKQIYEKSDTSKAEQTAKEAAEQIADMRAIAAAREAVIAPKAESSGVDQIIPADKLAKASADLKAKSEFAVMNVARIEALRKEVAILGDALKMKDIDMEKQSAKGLFGRMIGGLKKMTNPDVRKYEEKLALLNKLSTQHEEDNAGAGYWSNRANRALGRGHDTPKNSTGGPLGRG